MGLFEQIKHAREENNIDSLFECVPYSKLIGMRGMNMGKEIVFLLPKNEDNVGNPVLPALHGGAIGGFMENAALFHVLANTDTEMSERLPKVIDFSIDYLRAGRLQDTFAACQVVRKGRSVINVAVTAWQNHRHEPIARARAHLLL